MKKMTFFIFVGVCMFFCINILDLKDANGQCGKKSPTVKLSQNGRASVKSPTVNLSVYVYYVCSPFLSIKKPPVMARIYPNPICYSINVDNTPINCPSGCPTTRPQSTCRESANCCNNNTGIMTNSSKNPTNVVVHYFSKSAR